MPRSYAVPPGGPQGSVRGGATLGTAGLTAAIRTKGGVSFDAVANAYRAIVHSWDNTECIGEPQEWQAADVFKTEDAAMTFYKSRIRPVLERLMVEASRKVKSGTFMHRRLE